MSARLWRRKRLGLILSVISALVLGLSLGALLLLAAFGFMNGTRLAILGSAILVSLVLVVPSSLLVVRSNQELVRRGELDLKAMRQRSAETRRRSATRSLYTTPAYGVGLVLLALVLRWAGEPVAMPWVAVALFEGLLILTFVLRWFQRKRALRDAGPSSATSD